MSPREIIPPRWLAALAMVLLLISIPSTLAQQPSVEAFPVRGQPAVGDGYWNPESFGWFYYDIDSGQGGEMLSVDVEGRSIGKGHAIYRSQAWAEDFEFDGWNRDGVGYDAIAFLGKMYLAGYRDSSFTEAVSSLEDGEMREILLDDDNIYKLTYDDSIYLEEGYALSLGRVSEDDDVAVIVLKKFDEVVDEAVVTIGEDYVLEDEDDVPIIVAHLSNAMCGGGEDDCGVAEVNGVFQVSSDPVWDLSSGVRLGNLEVNGISEEAVELQNYEDLSLNRDSIAVLFGPLMLEVKDTPDLQYYPQGLLIEYGLQEVRGPVFTEETRVFSPLGILNNTFPAYALAKWDEENFSGFFYDPVDNLGNETLALYSLSDRTIPPANLSMTAQGPAIDGLFYTSYAQSKPFDYAPWGEYEVISLLGQQWFAGFGNDTSTEIGRHELLDRERMGRVLIDMEVSRPLIPGTVLRLEEGYTFNIIDISDDALLGQLRKDGELLENASVSVGSTYLYEKDLDEVDDFPLISFHLKDAFINNDTIELPNGTIIEARNNETLKLAMIDGIFQVSDSILHLERGMDFGELVLQFIDSGYILMTNPEKISLKKNSVKSLVPGIKLRVADNDTLRYYPYSSYYILPKPVITDAQLPDNISSMGTGNFTMSVKAGEIISTHAEVVDSDGRTLCIKDLTNLGLGSGDRWVYAWPWKAEVGRLSDNGSLVTDIGDAVPAVLFINETQKPVGVSMEFDDEGRIMSILDAKNVYYLSRAAYEEMDQETGYDEMINNSTAMEKYIKIKPGVSTFRLFSFNDGVQGVEAFNHTLSGSLEALEPHLVVSGAEPGVYDMRLRVENPTNAIKGWGYYFNVTGPEMPRVALGSDEVGGGENATIPLEVDVPGYEVKVEVSYNPRVVRAIEASGECPTPSYIDHEAGRVSVLLPAGCNSANLTFMAGDSRGETDLRIVSVQGLEPYETINGSIKVVSERQPGSGTGTRSGPVSGDVAAVAVAILGLAIAAVAALRRS